MKRLFSLLSGIGLLALCAVVASEPARAQNAPTKPLTIEAMFQPGGLGGRGPETIEWSPDGAKLSFVQRDEKGEKGELWYVDAATGEKKVLVSAAKLASLDPDVNKVKNEREKERLTRYHVAAYLWAPDSKHLIFDSQGQLWMYDLGTETAVQFTSAADPSGDPKFSPDGNHVAYVRKHNLYVRPVKRRQRKAADERYQRRFLERRYRLGLRGRAGGAQQLFLVARQQRNRVPAHGRNQGSDVSDHRLDADSSHRGSGEVSQGRRSEPGGEAGRGRRR